ncbi:MAG: tyrosine-type recombinase/integrase, partial [Dehalococcoidia bacterium]
CGPRASELTGLDLADYDRQAGEIRIRHGKGDKPRRLGVPGLAAASLNHYIARWRGQEEGPLFPGSLGVRLGYAGLLHLVRRLGAGVGVVGAHPHMFRHGFAVEFLLAGGPLPILQTLLGHSSIEQTARYLRTLQAEEATARHRELFRAR